MKKSGNKINFFFLQCFFYNLSFNILLSFQKLETLTIFQKSYSILINLIIGFILTQIIFLSLKFSKRFYFLVSSFLFFISSLSSYFLISYKAAVSETTLELMMYTNPEEILNLLTPQLLLWMIFFSGIGIWLSIKSMKTIKISKKSSIFWALLTFAIIISEQNFFFEQFYPFNLIHHTKQLLQKKISSTTINHFESNTVSLKENAPDKLLVVLIIGESARGDHFSQNGYHRPTTQSLDQQNNVISFDQACSCSNTTHISVPCLLTRASKETLNPIHQESSIIQVFNKAGFHSTWIGNQGGYFSSEGSFMRLAKEAHELIVPSRALYKGSQLDEKLLPILDQKLAERKNHEFIVLHMMGSHYHYEARYPSEYTLHEPICKKARFSRDVSHCSLESILNSYDNSLYYTSNFLNEVINRVKNERAFVLYASDHGESLGENGIYLHGTVKAPEQYNIPFIVWASDQYLETDPDIRTNLLKKQHEKISHDYIFYTLMDAGFIDSDLYNPSLSLLKK